MVITYPAPAEETPSKDFSIEVNGKPVFPYQAKVFDTRHGVRHDQDDVFPFYSMVTFGYFDFDEPVTVKIACHRGACSAKVRPLSYNIEAVLEDDVITFTLDTPRNLTIELNDSEYRCLHLFANPIDENAPSPDDPNVVYFGPGVHHIRELKIESGQTVYVAGGAIVMAEGETTHDQRLDGVVVASGTDNVTIRGRGIVDTSLVPWRDRRVFYVHQSKNVELNGIILRDACCWGVHVQQSEDIHIDNIKHICYRINSDGIDVVNSQHVLVENCFIRNKDDSLAVKALMPDAPSRDIEFRNNVVWNDWGYSLGVTYEIRSEISNVVFKDNDVIHSTWANGTMCVMGVYNGDAQTVHDILFEDIRVERARNPLLGLKLETHPWTKDDSLGCIRDITFKNIAAPHPATMPPSPIWGDNPDSVVEHVTIKGLILEGQPVTDIKEANLKLGNHADNLTLS